MAFVDACVASPTVDVELVDAVAGVLSPREIVTVLLLVGHYMSVARLTGVLEVPPDARPDPWTTER